MDILEKCVHCGSCLPICPIFRVTKQESLSPRGKLYYLLVKGKIPLEPELEDLFNEVIFACTNCGACKEVCSAGVDLLDLFIKSKGVSLSEKMHKEIKRLRDTILSSNNIFAIDNDERIELLLEEIEDEIEGINERIWQKGKTADVVVFLGCLPSMKSSLTKAVLSSLKVLEKLNINYLLLGGEEFCCGHPLDVIGLKDELKELRAHNTEILNSTNAKYIITNCPGCLSALTHHYTLNGKIKHFTEFILEKLPDKIPKPLNREIFYHEPCDLARICGIKEPPIRLLEKIGVKIIEGESSCCGGGGMLRLTNENISQKIIKKRIKDNNISSVVTCCPSCEEQFRTQNLETFDIMELVDEALGD